YHLVKSLQLRSLRFAIQLDLSTSTRQAIGIIGDGITKFALSRDMFGEVELPAQFRVLFEQDNIVAAFGRDGRARQTGGSAAYHGDTLGPVDGPIEERRLTSRSRIDEAIRDIVAQI